MDVHCWAFTPDSFIASLATLFEIGLTSFAVQSLVPTERDDLEFFCVLERLPRALDDAERQQRQLESVHAVARAHDLGAGRDKRTMTVSSREARLIERKRELLARARQLRQRFRR